jgi:hypothetical protein
MTPDEVKAGLRRPFVLKRTQLDEQHAIIAASRAAIRALAGASVADQADLHSVHLLDAAAEAERIALRSHLEDIGYWLCEYGQRALWKALWCRYGANCNTADGWAQEDNYHEGDELRFVYHASWEQHRDRLDREAQSRAAQISKG